MTKARDLANSAAAFSAVSATELGYVDGVTSAIQTQIDGKQAVNANVSTTELGYLDGVTSAIQTQVDAKIAKTLTSTTGDIIYASAANTPARLGIGSSAQVLTVTGGVPVWATPAGGGGWTQIGSTQTLNGASNYTLNTTTGYRNWVIELDDPYGASGDINPYIYFNGDTTNANYRGCVVRTIPAGFQSAAIDVPTAFYFALEATSANDNYSQIQVFDPDATTHRKGFNCNSVVNASTGPQVSTVMFQWENAAAITSVRVQTDTGTNFAGGTFKIWGLK